MAENPHPIYSGEQYRVAPAPQSHVPSSVSPAVQMAAEGSQKVHENISEFEAEGVDRAEYTLDLQRQKYTSETEAAINADIDKKFTLPDGHKDSFYDITGKFREDLYYRLNAVSISMPALRERPADINTLFRKFASDFSAKYGVCKVSLTEDAAILLRKYRWPGNIRQLKNVAETISALESVRLSGMSDKCVIDVDTLARYIPKEEPNLLPAKVSSWGDSENPGEREAVIRMLFQLKQDVDYLKEVIAKAGIALPSGPAIAPPEIPVNADVQQDWTSRNDVDEDPEEQEYQTETPDLSLKSANMELIEKVLRKHGGNRKAAAAELGISERTLYRKIKNLNK